MRVLHIPRQPATIIFMQENQKDSYTVEVGERLRDARRAVVPKMTQAKAAELLSKESNITHSPTRIANYEQGTRLPHPKIVEALCRIYGTTTPSYVLGLSDALLSQRELKHMQMYRMADERGKKAIDIVSDSQSAYTIGHEGSDPIPEAKAS